MNEVVIDVKNLSKAYKIYNKPVDRLKESLHPLGRQYHQEFFAVKDLSFSIRKGEMVGIIGRNGSGKSTLLKMLTGVLTPTSGQIDMTGRVSALLELGAGFNPEFTGRENIYFHGTIMGYTKEEMDSKVDAILEFADIGQFIEQPVKTYSSGMFVRLAFAVAIAVEPEILIIDEALAVGDLRFQQKAIRKMKELMAKAKAILFVSHDMRSVRTFCNRVIWLADGRLFQSGEPKKVARLYEDFMIHGILPEEKAEPCEREEITVTGESNGEAQREAGSAMTGDCSDTSKETGLNWLDLSPFAALGGEATRFIAAALVLPEGKDSQDLQGDELLTLYTRVAVQKPVYQPLFGFGIFNDKGVPLVHFNSDTALTQVQCLHESTEPFCIRYCLKLPGLRPGTYFISIGLDEGTMEDHTVVHHVSDCFSLKVNRQDRFGRQHGAVIVTDAQIDFIEQQQETED
ncbi:MAG: ABC transporter ATP-binding protein [Sporomusaceae bacterium]|nr:ABC transporter ATP-binding protein [Sporomusaceae bacterium]